ncbi:MAG: membrane protein insertase YidC [Robiginitomaculum sp.]|nr:MAG: membrane protein insertase YidC [Robiginitomaculum sp.]
MDDQKRFLLAMLLSGLVMAGYFFFFAQPAAEQAKLMAQEEIAASQQKIEQVLTPTEPVDRSELIAIETSKGTRINIETPSLTGSFSTTGSRFDDLRLKNFKQTIKKDSETIILFSPQGSEFAAEVFDNWVKVGGASGGASGGGSGIDTPWGVVSGDTLTPTSPITLRLDGDGYSVQRVISVDENFLFTLDDTITNTSSAEISLVRKGAARQYGLPDNLLNFFILQEGAVGVVDGTLKKWKYKKLAKKKSFVEQGESGWIGLTDRYWLSAAIAPQGTQMSANVTFKNLNGSDVYEAGYNLAPTVLSPGISVQSTGYIYAGAKSHTLLKEYMDTKGIARMDLAVDYGVLRILTVPMSWGLTKLGNLTGNFGVGILLMTLILKLILFPLNNKAYSSMAKMRGIAPKVAKMKERYGDDRMKLQQETMALYKKEGVSPVAGCLPMIPQMFIFFALYKSLFITFEMRHAPFFGYLKDLSDRDPLSIMNGFGLFPWDGIPFEALSFFALGPLALLYGITMALMQTLNTPPTDKMQARIMQLMPLFFMFILAPFAAGLLLYWVWNNILTIFQQYYITRKNNVHTPLDAFFNKIFGDKDKKLKAAGKKPNKK